MKKLILIFLTCLLGTLVGLYIYNKSNIGHVDTTKTDTGVIINGVTWATRNVATPGTFVSSAEDYGYFYQWNSKVGWPATGAIGNITASDGSTTWNSRWSGCTTPSSSDTWTSTNDPSPSGWRVPTYAEIKTLFDTTKVTRTWTTKNGVKGEKFTDKTTGNFIFLPASGYRDYCDGMLGFVGLSGYYWGSTAYDAISTYALDFGGNLAGWYNYGRANGQSVRPVAE